MSDDEVMDVDSVDIDEIMEAEDTDTNEVDEPGSVEKWRENMNKEYLNKHQELSTLEDEDNLNPKQLARMMRVNDQLYVKVLKKNTKERNEVALSVKDAVIMNTISRLCKQKMEQMSANALQFQYQEYAQRMVLKMRGVVKEDGQVRISKRKIVQLGREAKVLFHKAPVLSFLNGILRDQPPERKERKQKEAKAKPTKKAELVSTQAMVLEESETSGAQTEQMVAHTGRCLVDRYKENGKKPVNYFRFVVDPSNYGKTIENMFHVSFLIKEQKAKIMVENGAPLIRPFKIKATAEGSARHGDDSRCQVIMNMCMYDWERIINAYGIKETMISPLPGSAAPKPSTAPKPGPSSSKRK